MIRFQEDMSNSFRMERGVRQGAASSVLLFNSFMDDLFQYLDDKCSLDDLLNNIHVLIHADDTIILSTERSKFIDKCNEVVRYFHEHQLKLNLGKSAYLVINPKQNDLRSCINLESGVLKYKSCIEYLKCRPHIFREKTHFSRGFRVGVIKLPGTNRVKCE